MKLKYLNQNVVFVISGTQASDGQDLDSLLTVQLVDTITGQVLYGQSLQVRHRETAECPWSIQWHPEFCLLIGFLRAHQC